MFYSLRDQYNRRRFHFACRDLLGTPPARLVEGSPLTLFTQLRHKDVMLALLAFKSFAAKVPVGHFCVLNDGSLTVEDQDMLRRHLPSVRLLNAKDFASPTCPHGGTWERLLAIAELVRDSYVIQLDSDTLSIGEMPEIAESFAANSSFVIGTWDNQIIETMANHQARAAKIAAQSTKVPHIQITAEATFNGLMEFESLNYVRGCSGFAGFGKGSFERGFLEQISGQMLGVLGERWHEWGSEQVMSNIVVANIASSQVLPHPKYCDCTKIRSGETAFIHFIGSCRFVGGTYAKLAREVIQELRG